MVRETINRIEEIFAEINGKFPCERVMDKEIYYMNGNDGTDFDWEVNGRLCEFMQFHENEYGYIKFTLGKNDMATAYVYPTGEHQPKEKISYEFPKGSARELATAMFEMCDENSIWDKPISELDFDNAPTEWAIDKDTYEEW